MSKSLMMHCTYRPKVGQEEALFDLVKKHWPVLRKAGLASDVPALLYRATEKKTGRPFYIEIFSWRDEKAPSVAHQMPEVMAIWEPMGPMIEGGPSPELAAVEPVSVSA
jgi:hypothetical protein